LEKPGFLGKSEELQKPGWQKTGFLGKIPTTSETRLAKNRVSFDRQRCKWLTRPPETGFFQKTRFVKVDGGYYPSHLLFKTGQATFTASGS
jgi:hypothetical protein